jgi:hypothetical protein
VLGKDQGSGAPLRALVLPRDDGHQLLVVRVAEGGPYVETYKLQLIERGGFARVKSYVFFLEDHDPIGLEPQNCSCGQGEIAYYDPTPGFERVPARMPEGLEIRV